MKKLWILCLCFLLVGCVSERKSESDLIIASYENLNNQKDASGHQYSTVNIETDTEFVLASYDDIFNVLDNSGVILLAFPECPWCRKMLPVLIEAVNEVKIDKIYYLNNKDDRNEIKEIEGKYVETKEGSQNYYSLLDKLSDYVLDYCDSKRIYYPTVIVVKNGEILLYHTKTLDSDLEPYQALTSDQKDELFNIFKNALNKYKNTCSIEGC